MKVLIAGASGLIGSELVKLCLSDSNIETVHVLVRTLLESNDSKLVQHLVNYDELLNTELPNDLDLAFNCLGTTINNAGSQEAFKKVDYHYVTELSKLCDQHEIKSIISVSSMGANPKSKVFYYRVKGLTEDFLVNDSRFENVLILRPSLLLGKRKEFRAAESFAKVIMTIINFLFIGNLRRHKAIPGRVVARAMLNLSKMNETGKKIIENDAIFTVAYATE